MFVLWHKGSYLCLMHAGYANLWANHIPFLTSEGKNLLPLDDTAQMPSSDANTFDTGLPIFQPRKIYLFSFSYSVSLPSYRYIKENKTTKSQQECGATNATWKIFSSGFCILGPTGDIIGKSSHKMLGHLQSHGNNDAICAKSWTLKHLPLFPVSCLDLTLETGPGLASRGGQHESKVIFNV